jgi:hypothetical protein
MRLSLPVALAVAVAAVAAGVVAARLVRRRRELGDKTRRPALPPGPPVEEPAAHRETDEPISRETRFDELLDEEEQRRQAATRRLEADPFSRRLEEDAP